MNIRMGCYVLPILSGFTCSKWSSILLSCFRFVGYCDSPFLALDMFLGFDMKNRLLDLLDFFLFLEKSKWKKNHVFCLFVSVEKYLLFLCECGIRCQTGRFQIFNLKIFFLLLCLLVHFEFYSKLRRLYVLLFFFFIFGMRVVFVFNWSETKNVFYFGCF